VANQTGLDQLDARRQRAARQVPTPHHAKARVATAEPAVETASDAAPTPLSVNKTAPETTPEPVSPAPARTPKAAPAPESAAAPQRKPRFRQTQVLFDARADAHLSELKKRAVMADVDLSASAVLRRALEEYVEAHSYDEIVAWFAEHGR
jgi:hypothetical protein